MKTLQDVCPVLLIFVVIVKLVATVSSDHVDPNTRSPFMNMGSPSTNIEEMKMGILSDSPRAVEHHAIYRATSESGYSGGMATLDVSSFPNIKNGELTAAILWVSSEHNEDRTDLNSIQAGWVVNPQRFGDSKAHFFIFRTLDGFNGSTGCYNLDCDAFVPVNDAPITPGDTLESGKGYDEISFKIFKSKDDGDWWLHFGYDINNLKPVGFWRNSQFTKLKDHAKRITWGGYASCYSGNPSPPMGNGQWPGKNSARFQNVQFVDTSGTAYEVPAWSLSVYSSNKKCYQASPFSDSMFYYGGPGGCIN